MNNNSQDLSIYYPDLNPELAEFSMLENSSQFDKLNTGKFIIFTRSFCYDVLAIIGSYMLLTKKYRV